MKKHPAQFFCLLLLMVLSLPLHAERVLAELEYFYAPDGTLTGKAFNGRRVNFEYDLRGQLLAVTDAQGNDLERYTYDPAGNRLSKTVGGVTTTYTYDEANQLISSTVNGVTTHYKYDAAGRLVQAGDKSYLYNGRNKVVEVRRNGGTVARFEYNIDGQISKAIYGTKVEEFIWDGLALVWRSGITYVNEPYITGGNPVLAGADVLFNDMLGSTLAINGDPVEMTSFGETGNPDAFFTGKPMVDELGYAFLFRDYNPAQGKWTTTDPLGYPDGWNNLAYCNNDVVGVIDWLGGLEVYIWTYRGKNDAWGHASVKLDDGTYISWWPEGENRESIPLVEDIYTADAIKDRTFVQDVTGEDGRSPDVTIPIHGLDEVAIAIWWDAFKNDPNNKWKTLSQNCSTTVADALKAGNASTPWWDFWSSWNIVWTPADVEDFAHAINRKLE